MVLREGLGFEEYGLVDAREAKKLRLGESSSECCRCLPSRVPRLEKLEHSVDGRLTLLPHPSPPAQPPSRCR